MYLNHYLLIQYIFGCLPRNECCLWPYHTQGWSYMLTLHLSLGSWDMTDALETATQVPPLPEIIASLFHHIFSFPCSGISRGQWNSWIKCSPLRSGTQCPYRGFNVFFLLLASSLQDLPNTNTPTSSPLFRLTILKCSLASGVQVYSSSLNFPKGLSSSLFLVRACKNLITTLIPLKSA